QEFRAKLTNKYVNDYQLIGNKGRLTEQRKLLKGTIKQIAGKEALLRLDAFISKNTSLIPLSLLGPGLQDRFYFRFVKYDTIKGVKTAIIESFPKDPEKTQSIYGKLWVDLEDFSIVRISVTPVSIGGYNELLKRAKYYNSILILTCDIDFFKKHGGIRFPTEVVIREIYNGGVELKKLVGQPIWERSKTIYTFSDYQFFEVEATAGEEEVKK
ncbi:MAG: outer membrane lipoprotein-sorting protein, partial [Candidatus Aminicenantes bacterium]|nr:outer membrane lipoprotein-sorting protein [Candidatus Aminicenantes bacterium]